MNLSQMFEPQNPDYDAAVRDSLSRQPFIDTVGAAVHELKPGYCELTMQRRHDFTQQHGFFHGGIVASLLDSAAGYAAYSLYPKDSTVLTVEYKVNFLKPAMGDRLFASARVIKPGKTLYICQADAYVETGDERSHCLTGVFTMMCLMGKPDAINLGRQTD